MEYSSTYRQGPSLSYWRKMDEYDRSSSAEGSSVGQPQPPDRAHVRHSDHSPRRGHRPSASAADIHIRADAREHERDRLRSRREGRMSPIVPPAPEIPMTQIPTSRNADILTMSQGPRDAITDETIQQHLVICVYRNSQKDFASYQLSLLSRAGHPTGYITDRPFFRRVYRHYNLHLRSWFRRLFSFKTITTVRLIQFGSGQFYAPPQDSPLFSSAFMKALKDPNMHCQPGSRSWVEWIGSAKRNETLRYLDIAIELKEDYDAERLVMVAGFILLAILILTAIWLVKGGDASYVSGVMSYVLTFAGAIVGLTALWDWFDAGRAQAIQELAAPMLPDDFGKTKDTPFSPRVGR